MTEQDTKTTESIKARLVTMREAAQILGISQRGLYRFVASGELPPPVKIGSASRMVLSEIDAYIEKAKAARPNTSANRR